MTETLEQPRKRATPFANAMFWMSMMEAQVAIDRFTGELEAESDKLARLMCKWSETHDEELLNAFDEAAPSFVDRCLAALGMDWEQVRCQLEIWAALKGARATFRELGEDEKEIARQAERNISNLAKQEAIPVLQATTLITIIWPTIQRNLASWKRMADAAGIDHKEFGKMSMYEREHALYRKQKSH